MKPNKAIFSLIIVSYITLNLIQAQNTVKDADGNIYKTITIGKQTWMAENLKTTKYNDGSAIPLVTDSIEWAKFETIGYCWYENNDAKFKSPNGALYNWNTVNTGKLCPSGWHVPANAEWARLINVLGGDSVAGGKMKETGPKHWNSPNTGATNESGFTALPGGLRNFMGGFGGFGIQGSWWSFTRDKDIKGFAWCMDLYSTESNAYRSHNGIYTDTGLSVRCIKD